MRIAKLSLIAFGPFEGEELVLGEPGSVDVVYGHNEAGKSTSLRAVVGALYGIDVQTKDAFLHDMTELRIGATLTGEAGESFVFVRRKGKKGHTLLDEAGQSIDEAPLARMLGNTPREVFESTYGLDHVTLRSGARELLEGKGDLGETLFGASLGSTSLHALRKQVDDEADAIYLPQAKVKPLNDALKKYSDKKKQLSESATSPAAYEAQRREIANRHAEAEMLRAKRAELTREQSRLQQLEKLLPELDAALSRRHELEAEEATLTERRSKLVVDAGLAAARDVMESVRERLSEQSKAVVELPEAKSALTRVEADVRAALRAAGEEGSADPDALLLDDATQAEIEQLVSEARNLEGREESAVQALNAARARLASSADAPAPLADATKLEAALSLAREAGDLDSSSGKQRARVAKLTAALRAKCEAVGGEAALSLNPPSMEAVVANERAAREGAAEVDASKVAVRGLRDQLTAQRLAIAQLEARGKPPSLADVTSARTERDERWRAFAEAKGEAKKKAEAAFLEQLRAADEAVDLLLRESTSAATHARLVLEQTALEERLETALVAESDAIAKLTATQREWQLLWAAAVPEPQPHEQMRAWLQQRAAALATAEELGDAKAELEATESRAASLTSTLTDALRGLGALVEPGSRFADVRALAERQLAQLLEARAAARDANVSRRAIEENVRVLEAELDARQKDRAKWQARWQRALVALQLPAETGDKAVAAALEARKRLANALVARAETTQRVERLQQTTSTLAELLAEPLEAHAPDLARAPTLEAARELVRRWSANEATTAEALRLDATLDDLRASLARERATIGRLRETTEEASRGLPNATVEIARARLTDIESELDEVNRSLDNTARNLFSAEKGLEGMSASSAPAAASEAEELLARVGELAQRYARLKLASAVLTRELDAFRSKHQGPVLKRASEHFATLTRGRYRGLREGFGANEEPVLRAVRGKSDVGVEGLSEGTRDALYLALRLASWEHLATTNVALPVVLDDVLVHFDDDRATAALELLGDVAAKMQIVLFTHHGKIVERAREALGARAHVTDLSSAART